MITAKRASPRAIAQEPPRTDGLAPATQKKSMPDVFAHTNDPGHAISPGTQRSVQTPDAHCPSAQSSSLAHALPSAPGVGSR